MVTTAPALAIVRCYDDLRAALRDRAEVRQFSRETLDEIAGLADGHSGHILAAKPTKRLGLVSMGPLLGALGVALAVIEDPAAMAKIEKRIGSGNLVKRQERFVRTNNQSRKSARRLGSRAT